MSHGFDSALRAELQRVIQRPPPRRRGTAAAAVTVVAAAALALASLLSPDTAAADVQITHDNGRVIVLLTDRENDADEIAEALDAEGLDIEVTSAPAGPSNVGRFIAESATDAAPMDLERIEAEGATFMGFSFPENWPGRLTVIVGRAALPGEAYRTFSDAYAPGEPLACSATLGQPLAEADEELRHLDVQVQRFVDGTPEESISLQAALTAGYGKLLITGATAMSSEAIVVDVAAQTSPATAPQQC